MHDPVSTLKLSVKEIEEALSALNAYYFFVQHGRPGQPLELIRWFAAHADPVRPATFQVCAGDCGHCNHNCEDSKDWMFI